MTREPMEYIEYRHNEGSRDKRILVLLHGYGSNEHDLPGLGSALSSDCTLLSLRAPIDLPFGGHAWFSLYPQEKGFKADIPEALKALDRLEQLLEELIERYAPASGKVWLLGFSQGSMLSQALMLRKSEQIEGVIGLSGYLPDPLIPKALPSPEQMPEIFLVHGTEDEVIDVEKARRSHRWYQEQGIPHEYHEFPIGHEVGMEEIDLMDKWWQKTGEAQ